MSFTLSYPYTTPTTTVVLRNPELGNTLEINQGVIHRNTRSGDDKHVYATGWPMDKVHKYSFKTLIKTKVDALRTFLQTTLAAEIKIVDHLSVTRKVIVIADSIEVVAVKDTCSYDVELQVMEV